MKYRGEYMYHYFFVVVGGAAFKGSTMRINSIVENCSSYSGN